MTSSKTAGARWLLGAAAVIAVVSLVSGYALGAVTVTSRIANGSGYQTTGSNLGYWTQVDVDNRSTIPGGGPGTLSSAAGSPTVLANTATNYVLSSAVGGHSAIRWNFTENASSPTSRELELTFTFTTTSSTTVTVYVETQSPGLGSPVTYSLYYDTGAGAAPPLNDTREFSQQCPAIGTCP